MTFCVFLSCLTRFLEHCSWIIECKRKWATRNKIHVSPETFATLRLNWLLIVFQTFATYDLTSKFCLKHCIVSGDIFSGSDLVVPAVHFPQLFRTSFPMIAYTSAERVCVIKCWLQWVPHTHWRSKADQRLICSSTDTAGTAVSSTAAHHRRDCTIL